MLSFRSPSNFGEGCIIKFIVQVLDEKLKKKEH